MTGPDSTRSCRGLQLLGLPQDPGPTTSPVPPVKVWDEKPSLSPQRGEHPSPLATARREADKPTDSFPLKEDQDRERQSQREPLSKKASLGRKDLRLHMLGAACSAGQGTIKNKQTKKALSSVGTRSSTERDSGLIQGSPRHMALSQAPVNSRGGPGQRKAPELGCPYKGRPTEAQQAHPPPSTFRMERT